MKMIRSRGGERLPTKTAQPTFDGGERVTSWRELFWNQVDASLPISRVVHSDDAAVYWPDLPGLR